MAELYDMKSSNPAKLISLYRAIECLRVDSQLPRGISFTTIHMPLVRTPMIAPTKMYDSFPAITPEEAADMICEAIRTKPKQINTRLGTFGEVSYALAPKAVDQILHMAYKVFPESVAAKGKADPDEHASMEQVAMANLMKGVHW